MERDPSRMFNPTFFARLLDSWKLETRSGRDADPSGPDVAPKHVDWIDIAKGICIVQVVWYHVAIGLERGQIGLPGPLQFLKSFTHSYNISCFFFLSGLLAHRALKKGLSAFAGQLARGILYPYFVWTFLQSASNAALGPLVNSHTDLAEVFLNLVTQPYAQYWYLPVLFIYLILYYLVGGWRAGGLALLFVGLFVDFAPVNTGIYLCNQLQKYLFFYASGAILGPALLRGRWRVGPATALVICGVLLGFELCYPGIPPRAVIFAFRVIGTVAVICVARAVELSGYNFWLREAGRYSLEIFLAFVFGAAGARIVLLKGLGVTSVPVHIIMGMAGGLIFPVVLAHLAAKHNFSFLFSLKDNRRRASSSPSTETGSTSKTVAALRGVVPQAERQGSA